MKHCHRKQIALNVRQAQALLLPLGLLLCLLGIVCPPAPAHAQGSFTFPVALSFKDASAPGWVLGGAAVLTSGNGDPAGDGWLRLTDNTTFKAGYAVYDTPIPTGRGLVVTFDYGAWGGTGADGLTFFLFDGATKTFNVGGAGGSLGYAQSSGVNGLSNGYLGLGLDEFGNYSNPNQSRVGGPGYTPQAVAIRGPGSGMAGYAYLAGTTRLNQAPWSLPRLDCPTNFGKCGGAGAPRPAPAVYSRQVQITVNPVGAAYQVAVAMKFSYTATTWTPLFGPFTMPTSAPGTLKMGFAASTGGNTNYHEIRNLNVTQQVPDLTATKSVQNATTGGGSVTPGDELLYTVALNNHTNAAITGVHFTDPLPAHTTYVASSATVPGGATLNATSPISVSNITVPAYGQATISFKVQVVNPIPGGVTQISNQGAYTYGAITALTDGDTVTEGNQATVIGVTAGPNFDTSTKTVTYEDLDRNGAVSPGDLLTYHVLLPNTGNQNAPTTAFADLLPSNTTYMTGTATVSSGTVNYNSLTRTLGWAVSIDAGSQATLDFKVTVNAGVKIRDVIANQGTTTYGTTAVLTDADLATPGKQPTEILAGGGATLAATKSATVIGGGDLQPGSSVRYTVLLTNTGSYSITGATFTDMLPANTTFVAAATDTGTAAFSAPALSVTGINLARGATATILLTVQLNSPLAGVTSITNQGVASYDSNQGGANNTSLRTDGDPATAGQQPTDIEIPNSNLVVTKAADTNNPVETGTVVYTVNVTNLGPDTATNVTVADPLPAGLTYSSASATAGGYTRPAWNVGALESGASATLAISATVDLGWGGATITNTANATAMRYDATPANNVASATIVVQPTTLTGAVTDAATGDPLVGVTVLVTDRLGNLCTTTTGAGGVYLVTSGQAGCLLAPGAATVAATGGAPTGYLLRWAPMTLTAGAANRGDLALVRPGLHGRVTDLGSGVALIDATVTLYQGPSVCTTTTGAEGAYNFMAGPTCNLTAGAATVTVVQPRYQPATASPTILDTGPTTQDLALGTADLLITKDDSKTVVLPNELLDYVITVVNQGSITATGILVTDTLPAYLAYVGDDATIAPANPGLGLYTWALGDLAPGASRSFTVQARVAASLPDGATSLTNYVNLSATSPDRDHTNNAVADVDTVVAHPDLTLFKSATADSSPIVAKGTITYTYIGDNRGSAIATGVQVTDTLDANTDYVAGSAVLVVGAATWPVTATYSHHQLVLALPNMPPGAEGNLHYRATVKNPLPAGTILVTNTAVVSSNEPDLDPRDNRSTVVLSALPGADVYVQKVALSTRIPALPGDQILYRLRYGNLSTESASGAVITDVIPANTSYVAGSLHLDGVNLTDAIDGDSGQVSSASRLITVSLGNLADGAGGVVTFTVEIDNVLPAGVVSIANTAFIASAVSDPVPGNNAATAVMDVAAQPDLTLHKTDGRAQVLAGDLLTYTITCSNTGNQVATGVKLTDTLLAGIEYVAASPGGVYGAGTVRWDIGALPVNDLRTLTVTVRVQAAAQPGAVVANRASLADDGANGADITPANNTATDSNLVIAPYLTLEKHAAGLAFFGQPVTYTIASYNAQDATAFAVIVTDTLPANTTLVPGSITSGGSASGGAVTWRLGNKAPGESSSLSFAVIPGVAAGGAAQTLPTLSSETIDGRLVVTSTTLTPPAGSRPWCDFAECAAFKGVYQGEDGAPPTGWNDNPRLATFDDSVWSQPLAANTAESDAWANPANLGAEWVAMQPGAESGGNFSFFRQSFCLPLNATGLNASIQVAGDDIADIDLNGVYLGQEVGAGAADLFAATAGVQSGGNLLSVQLLNNNHGGHAQFDGGDHSGLLFKLDASYTGLRPFAAAPGVVIAGQTVGFAVDELALGGRKPTSYTLDYGDGSAAAPYQLGTGFTHLYSVNGVYTATLTARGQDGCTGSDQLVITVLPATANLLANSVVATYRDANNHQFAAVSGAGVELLPAADLSVVKTLAAGARVPGQAVTYQVTVVNQGPGDVTGATVQDTLPAALTRVTWACRAGAGATCTGSGSGILTDTVSLRAGSSIVYTVTGTIAADATGLLENIATVTPPPGVTDLAAANNVSTDSGLLTPQANLAISKSSSPNPGLAPGHEIHYTIRVSNSGPSDAQAVNVTDAFPATIAAVTWTCTASSGSACATSGSGNLDELATILAGGAITYTASGQVDPGAAAGTVIANTATATHGGRSVSATDRNTLVAPTSLTATKEALSAAGNAAHNVPYIDADGNGGISPGDTLRYKVVIHNGVNTAYNVLFDDSLSANTSLVVGSVTCDQPCTVVRGNAAGNTSISVRLDNIAANGAVTLYYRVTVKSALPFQLATLANQGYVASANAATVATDDPATPEAADATVVALTMAAIRGVAWVDDGDGSRQSSEPGLSDVAVTLAYAGPNGQPRFTRTNTDATGAYTFTVLAAGNYQVGFWLREGFTYSPVWGPGQDNQVDPGTGLTAVIALGANEQRLNISSGLVYMPLEWSEERTFVAFEDLKNVGWCDWDYNDFIVRIDVAQGVTADDNLAALRITYEAMAHGGAYDHKFLHQLPVYGGGVYNLRVLDKNGNVVSQSSGSFGDEPTFTIFERTKQALPVPAQMPPDRPFTNTTPEQTWVEKGYTAQLTVVLADPFLNMVDTLLRLPWDPYLYVYNTDREVHLVQPGHSDNTQVVNNAYEPGNPMLGFDLPLANGFNMNWFWPQEFKGIWQVYPDYVAYAISDGATNQNWWDPAAATTNLQYAWRAAARAVAGIQAVASTTSRYFAAPVLSDLDNDGRSEILIGNLVQWQLEVYNADGSRRAGWPQYLRAEVKGAAVAADLDGDGAKEVLVGDTRGYLYAFHHDGRAVTGWPIKAGPADQAVPYRILSRPAVADLNNDGAPEVILALADGMLYVYGANGVLQPGWPVSLGAVADAYGSHLLDSSPVVANLDGDGSPEIVVGSYDKQLYAYHADGQLAWSFATGDVIAATPAVGDIDPTTPGLETVVGSGDRFVYLLSKDGVQLWKRPTGWIVHSSPLLADLDGDGNLEILSGSDDHRVWAWHHDGSRVDGWPQTTGAAVFSSPVLGDVDGDGQAEIVVASDDTRVHAWESNGATVQGWPQEAGYPVKGAPAVANMDADPAYEVIVANFDGVLRYYGMTPVTGGAYRLFLPVVSK